MKRNIWIVVLSTLLTACGDPYVRDSTPPLHMQVKAGDMVVVNKAITIPPYRTSLKFQFAEIADDALVTTSNRKYEAVCSLKLSKRQHKPYVVSPQDIKIKSVKSYEDILSVNNKYVGVYIYLASEKHPELTRIDCSDFTDAYEDHYFTVGLFEQSFGDYLSIKGQ